MADCQGSVVLKDRITKESIKRALKFLFFQHERQVFNTLETSILLAINEKKQVNFLGHIKDNFKAINQFLQRDQQQILKTLVEYIDGRFNTVLDVNYSGGELTLEEYLHTLDELRKLGHLEMDVVMQWEPRGMRNTISIKASSSIQTFYDGGGFLSHN